jgi:RNA polymerase sigma factor (TIGR02999 family)
MRGPNQEAVDRITPALYAELRRLAASYFRSEQPDNTLQPTALVHEAYLRLIEQKDVQFQNRAHFLGIAAQLMRRILVDKARRRNAAKRGGGQRKVVLEESMGLSQKREVDLMILDDLLERLSQMDARQARIVELRFFGGLSMKETADVLGVSEVTVKRDWSHAKAWLHREMSYRKTSEG